MLCQFGKSSTSTDTETTIKETWSLCHNALQTVDSRRHEELAAPSSDVLDFLKLAIKPDVQMYIKKFIQHYDFPSESPPTAPDTSDNCYEETYFSNVFGLAIDPPTNDQLNTRYGYEPPTLVPYPDAPINTLTTTNHIAAQNTSSQHNSDLITPTLHPLSTTTNHTPIQHITPIVQPLHSPGQTTPARLVSHNVTSIGHSPLKAIPHTTVQDLLIPTQDTSLSLIPTIQPQSITSQSQYMDQNESQIEQTLSETTSRAQTQMLTPVQNMTHTSFDHAFTPSHEMSNNLSSNILQTSVQNEMHFDSPTSQTHITPHTQSKGFRRSPRKISFNRTPSATKTSNTVEMSAGTGQNNQIQNMPHISNIAFQSPAGHAQNTSHAQKTLRRSPRKTLFNRMPSATATSTDTAEAAPGPEVHTTVDDEKYMRLVSVYPVTVSRDLLRKAQAAARKNAAKEPGYTLCIKLVYAMFTTEELAYSRGQGLSTSAPGDIRPTLNETKIKAIKGWLRFENYPIIGENRMNSAITEAIGYSRQKLKNVKK